MKTLKKSLILLFVGLISIGFAQDLDEAGVAFNDGNTAYKSKDYVSAIESYKSSIDMCQLIGADGAELQTKVEAQIVKAYWKNAVKLYKGKKFDAAVAEMKKTQEAAKVANNAKYEKYAAMYIPKIYSSKGLGLYTDKKYDDAIVAFEEALGYNDKCVDAFFGMGLTFKEKEDIDAALANFDKAIANGAGNKKAEKNVTKAKSAAQGMLVANGAKELQIEHTQKAIDYFTKAQTYGDISGSSYYYLALAYNKQKKSDDAIAAAKAGIALGGDVSDLQFELGKAYEAKGDTANACTAYKAVTTGPNVKAAAFQAKEVLKCN